MMMSSHRIPQRSCEYQVFTFVFKTWSYGRFQQRLELSEMGKNGLGGMVVVQVYLSAHADVLCLGDLVTRSLGL